MSKPHRKIKQHLNFTRQQLYHWRKKGLLNVQEKTSGKHCRYNLQEFQTLKVIKLLKEAGFSTFKIRKCFEKIKEMFEEIENPFVEKQILVFGGNIIFIHESRAYDALSGQILFLDFKEIEKWAGKVIDITDDQRVFDQRAKYFRNARFKAI